MEISNLKFEIEYELRDQYLIELNRARRIDNKNHNNSLIIFN